MSSLHVCFRTMCAGKPEEGVRGSETEVIDSCNPPYVLGTEHSSA